MNKKLIIFFVITLLVSVFINVVAGSWISAKLSNLPILERYHLFNPQAPIVITKRDDSPSSDPNDLASAAARSKSHLSSIITVSGNSITVNGSAINLSADGYFLTVQSALAKDASTQSIITNGGQSAKITAVYGEPGTNLVIVKADLSGVAVTDFAQSKSLAAGQRILFIHNSGTAAGQVSVEASYVTSAQNNTAGRIFNTDKPSRTFGAESAGALTPGEAIINLDGKIIGVWDGTSIVSSDVVNQTVKMFFNNNQKGISRPVWHFQFRSINSTEASLFQIPVGALVTTVDAGGAAASAGLKPGDSVTAVGGQTVDENTSLEELLQNQKPGQGVAFIIVRNKNLMTITVTPGMTVY